MPGFGIGLLVLGFWRWSFGIGLFTFEISAFGFFGVVFCRWCFCVGILHFTMWDATSIELHEFMTTWTAVAFGLKLAQVNQCLKQLKFGSSLPQVEQRLKCQAMTIAFCVSQFGRFGVVFFALFRFFFANGFLPLDFSVGFQCLAFLAVGSVFLRLLSCFLCANANTILILKVAALSNT